MTSRRVRKPSGATASAPVQAVLRAAALSCLLLSCLSVRAAGRPNVLIILTDNGGTAGVKHYNAGMRGGKTSVHEGGSRVPLFIHWPAAGWRPRIVENLTAHVDIYPTLLDICAIPPPAGPKPDGISLRPLLEGRDGFPQNRTLFIHNGIDETNKWPGAVRTPRYRLVRKIKGPAAGSSAVNADHTVGAWQLYDMHSDPGESVDIAARSPDVVRELAQRYDQWFADISTPLPCVRRFPWAMTATIRWLSPRITPSESHLPCATPPAAKSWILKSCA